ncbi:hypothetical protein BOTBODRAFT_27792 [Botryobasidium botryosum FD-172 SS1]|uniref:Galactokinase n=1 Tax=Botryobasidium botryosum (strain FD-172 SS1) TaxID=930990 RepID=A0A067N601_BOTB1|nr:hypothetical protein BOTBODRAFT_27792 [Botryobasidium botryosum FD-172 SS1]
MASAPISTFTSLGQIHSDAETLCAQSVRWSHLTEEFVKRFGTKPTHICRAPGRVNLIGEHIDYALFSVFPAAIERDILIACAARPSDNAHSGSISIQSLDGERYAPQSFQATRQGDQGWQLDIDKTQLRWESYVKAGYHGVLKHFFSDGAVPQSANLLVNGTVPAGSGLSSSAALVVASTLAFLAVNKKLDKLDKGELVKIAMENEKRVGVNSGGMDQAASVLSLPHHALYISFHPALQVDSILLPRTSPSTVFVIANSLKVADKLVSSRIHYNLRVVETLVAARVLARGLGVHVGREEKVTLREVLDRWLGLEAGAEATAEQLEGGLERILSEVDTVLGRGAGKDGLSMKEMIEASGLGDDEFNSVYLSWVDVEATKFQLYKRTKHVFSEALRVLRFRRICLSTPGDAEPSTLQIDIGNLMNESQESCASLFDCSCPELDELTKLARESGAWGSRLTGAGWGGCTVSLVSETDVPEFIEKMRRGYGPYESLSDEQLEQVIFATKPGSGAGVLAVED